MSQALTSLFRNRTFQIAGLSIPSLYFYSSFMSSASSSATKSLSGFANNIEKYTPRHTNFPYTEKDFQRHDTSPDNDFYAQPRIVHHIDDAARASLSRYYDFALPRQGRLLDFCSSWVSHYPARIQQSVEDGEVVVVGMGMNDAELRQNPVLSKRILQDLNTDPEIPASVCAEGGGDDKGLLDASTCVVSIDYLIHPVEVLASLRQRTKIGGTVHLVISNRCFPTKAVARWLRLSEEERLMMVGDYLWFSGWRDVEIVDVKAGDREGEDAQKQGQGQGSGGLQGFMAQFGLGHQDPLWVVRAKRVE